MGELPVQAGPETKVMLAFGGQAHLVVDRDADGVSIIRITDRHLELVLRPAGNRVTEAHVEFAAQLVEAAPVWRDALIGLLR